MGVSLTCPAFGGQEGSGIGAALQPQAFFALQFISSDVECPSVFVCTLMKGRGLRLGSWLVLLCLEPGKKHFMVLCLFPH